MTNRCALGAAVALALVAAGPALAQIQPPSFTCTESPPQRVIVVPVPRFTVVVDNNRSADCTMWQTFFYLNWPVLPGKRGEPNMLKKFGTPGPTVWESFKTVEQVFLANGAAPAGWDQNVTLQALAPGLAAQVAAGSVRLLSRTNKISNTVLSAIAQGPGVDQTFLSSIQQAGGTTLWDQQRQPVYYEIAMNRKQFDYIRSNKLYNLPGQSKFIQTQNIALPVESIELKAAWKVLTPAEAGSGRFHTTRAYLGGSLQPATVGLVGLHVFTGSDSGIGLWGTFAHIDNAPVKSPVTPQKYTFYNPDCLIALCPVNSTKTNPTQVVQQFADGFGAPETTTDAWRIIKQYNEQNKVINSPWLNYKLVDVQWSAQKVVLKTPVPITVPLPIGDLGALSTQTLMNAVLETFVQTPDTSCVQCHRYASSAADTSVGSGFSFMFGYASAPPSP